MREWSCYVYAGVALIGIAWHLRAKSKSRDKQITQKDPPKKVPAEGVTQKCSQNFRMDLPPGTLQSDIDQKIFYPDWTMRPGWKVSILGVRTKRGYEHEFTHKKTGGSYLEVDLFRRRDWWAQITEDARQEELARTSKFAPYYGDGGGFPW
jgi:hypothetical protein